MTDTRVYDITIYDETGSALCFMNEFELRKNAAESVPHIDRRYEMVLQPVLPNAPSPRLMQTWAQKPEIKAKGTKFF